MKEPSHRTAKHAPKPGLYEYISQGVNRYNDDHEKMRPFRK